MKVSNQGKVREFVMRTPAIKDLLREALLIERKLGTLGLNEDQVW